MIDFEFLYFLVPMLSAILLVLSYFFKFYKRSVSTFLSLHMVALSSNAIYFYYFKFSMLIILFFMLVMFVRAMTKDKNDKWFRLPYDGVEKRNSRSKINAYY